ncbi:seipin-like [Glandiceps talaboti]
MLSSYVRSLNTSAYTWFIWVRSTTAKFVFYSSVIVLILWVSIFLYGSFYYAYMPTVEHVRPVHLHYSDCSEGTLWKAACPYPTANVTLLDEPSQRQQFLMRGQPYRVMLNLEMPQSPVNENIGVFMVKISFYSDGDEFISMSSRPAMLHFKSFTLKLMETIFLAPLLIGGFSEEKQVMEVELYDKFQDSPYKPTIGAIIEVQAKSAQIYSSVLRIQARFTGLRYLMFEWPILTATFGVGTNFLILFTVAIISWLRWFNDYGEQEAPHVTLRLHDAPQPPDFGNRGQVTGRTALEQQPHDTPVAELPSLQLRCGSATHDTPPTSQNLSQGEARRVDTLLPGEGVGSDGNASTSSCDSGSFEKIESEIILQEQQEASTLSMAPEGSHVRLRHPCED